MLNKKDAVILQYVTWMLKENRSVDQKYLDYLDARDLLRTAIEASLEK